MTPTFIPIPVPFEFAQEQVPSFLEEIAPVLTPTQKQALASDLANVPVPPVEASIVAPEVGPLGPSPDPPIDLVKLAEVAQKAIHEAIFVPTGTGMGTYGGRPVCYQPTPGAVDLYDPLSGELVASGVPWIGKAGA